MDTDPSTDASRTAHVHATPTATENLRRYCACPAEATAPLDRFYTDRNVGLTLIGLAPQCEKCNETFKCVQNAKSAAVRMLPCAVLPLTFIGASALYAMSPAGTIPAICAIGGAYNAIQDENKSSTIISRCMSFVGGLLKPFAWCLVPAVRIQQRVISVLKPRPLNDDEIAFLPQSKYAGTRARVGET